MCYRQLPNWNLDKNRRAGHLHVKLLWKFLKKNLC